jgi:peptidoglycan hydrolase-like protein with peptidoglycan-binding domain
MSSRYGFRSEPFQGFTEFDEFESLGELDEFSDQEFSDPETFETDFEVEPEEERRDIRVRGAGGRRPARAGAPARGMGRLRGRRPAMRPRRPGMRPARGMKPGRPGRPPRGSRPLRPIRRPFVLPAYPGYVVSQPMVEGAGGICPTVGRFGNWLRSDNQVTVLLDEDDTPIEGGPEPTAGAPAPGGPEASAGPEGGAGPAGPEGSEGTGSQPDAGEPGGTAGEFSGVPYGYELDQEGRPMTRRGRWSRQGSRIVVHLDDPRSGEYEQGEVPLLKKGIAAAGARAAAQAKKLIAKAKGGLAPEKVCWIQNVLNVTQGESLVVDGIFGPKTRAAVTRFQTKNGLKVDGIVGPETETALIQAALNQIAQASLLPVSGVKDARTRQEIINFQASKGLVTDGIVGPKTRAAMVTALGGRCVFPKPKPKPPGQKPPVFVQVPSTCNRDELIRLVDRCVEDSKRCLVNAHQDLGLALLACKGDPVCNAVEMGKYLLALKRCRDALLLCDQDARKATKCP